MKGKTILLIHGLWLTPSCWQLFRQRYSELGYTVLVPGWPGVSDDAEQMRRDSSALAGLGLVEIADHYHRIIHALDEEPILIGHSFGGLIVQMLLDRGLGAAGVSIDGISPKGIYQLPLSALKATFPFLRNPLNYGGTVRLSFEQFHHFMDNTMDAAEAKRTFDEQVIPGPGRPLFQAALANLFPNSAASVNHRNYTRAPLLLASGKRDNLAPASLNEANYRLYRHSTAVTDLVEFADRSHLLILRPGWEEAADYIDGWLHRRLDFMRRPIEHTQAELSLA